MGCWFREISSGLPLQQAYLPSRSLAPGPKDGVLLVNSNARPQSGFVALRGRMVVWIKELIRWTKVVPCWKSRLDPKKSRGKRPKLIYHLFLHFFPMVLHGLTIEIAIFFIIFLDKPVYLWKPLECCIRNLLGVLNRPNYNFPTKSLLDPCPHLIPCAQNTEDECRLGILGTSVWRFVHWFCPHLLKAAFLGRLLMTLDDIRMVGLDRIR